MRWYLCILFRSKEEQPCGDDTRCECQPADRTAEGHVYPSDSGFAGSPGFRHHRTKDSALHRGEVGVHGEDLNRDNLVAP